MDWHVMDFAQSISDTRKQSLRHSAPDLYSWFPFSKPTAGGRTAFLETDVGAATLILISDLRLGLLDVKGGTDRSRAAAILLREAIHLAVDGNDEEMEDADAGHRLVGQYTASRSQIDELAQGNGVEEEDILGAREKQARIADRETDYQKRRFNRGPLTPTRADPFAANTHANVEAGEDGQTYREVMALRELEKALIFVAPVSFSVRDIAKRTFAYGVLA